MSTADWWARKLNAPAPPRPAVPTAAPAPAQAAAAPSSDSTKHAERAQAAHDQGNCPDCGSDNYFQMHSEDMRLARMPAAARCYDCGYPIKHTTSGMGGIRGNSGQSKPSKQSGNPATSNYHPDVIIGRVG